VENIAQNFPPAVNKEFSHEASRATGAISFASLENE
jgi:hypothetical protein